MFERYEQEFPVQTVDKTSALIPCDAYEDIPEYINDIQQKDGFSLGDSLPGVFPLLDIIFEYLQWKDLNAASLVCTSWKEVADRIKTKRNAVNKPFFYVFTGKSVIRSNNYYHHNYDFVFIVYYPQFRKGHKKYLYKNKECGEVQTIKMKKTAEYIEKKFDVENAMVIPSMEVCFQTQKDMKVVAVSIPKLEGIRFVYFQTFEEAIDDTSNKFEMNGNEKILALQWYSSYNNCRNTSNLDNFNDVFRDKCHKNMAFSGGIKNKRPSGFVVIEDSSVSKVQFIAVSQLIFEHEDVETTISRFKEDLPVRDNIFIITSLCCGRDDAESSSKVLLNYFPNAYHIGADVSGEFGINSKKQSLCDSDSNQAVTHSYTMSLMFLMWNNNPKPCYK